MANEDFSVQRDQMRDEILEMVQMLVDGPPFIPDTTGEEISEDMLLGVIAGRCAIVATMNQHIDTGHSEPPSIWLGAVAGMLLSAEVETITEIAVDIAKIAKDN